MVLPNGPPQWSSPVLVAGVHAVLAVFKNNYFKKNLTFSGFKNTHL